MKKEKFFTIALILFILFAGLVYLYSHLMILGGVLKERAEKECVSAVAISNWEHTLKLAQDICIEGQKNYLTEIKSNYKEEIEEYKKDAKYWKDSYLWLKKQNEEKINEQINGDKEQTNN